MEGILRILFGLVGVGVSLAMAVPSESAPSAGSPVPKDLVVEYRWRAGTMPPPHHYGYSVRIGPGLTGKMTLVPDYPGKDVPVWIENFKITSADLQRLHSTLRERGLYTRKWKEVDPSRQPVGGALHDLEVVANGRRYEIPHFPAVQGDREAASAIYQAVNSLVPRSVRENLLKKRVRYVEEFEKNPRP